VSRYKVYRSREFIPGYKVGCGHWRSVAVQTISKAVIYHGAGFKLLANARVRVQQSLQICLDGRSKSKKCDKQLTHIVRVSVSFILIFNNLKQDITKIEMLPIKGNNLALSRNNQFN
jgi:hypothetical protein